MRARVAELVRDGVTVLVLLALSDDGVPAHDHHEAEALAALGATVTSCTPDEFPDVLAATLLTNADVPSGSWSPGASAQIADDEDEAVSVWVPTLRSLERALGVDAGVLGEAEHPLADDVAHDLVAAAGDAAAGRAEQRAGTRRTCPTRRCRR